MIIVYDEYHEYCFTNKKHLEDKLPDLADFILNEDRTLPESPKQLFATIEGDEVIIYDEKNQIWNILTIKELEIFNYVRKS